MDMVNEWLKAAGLEIGAPLELNEEGICAVECENNVTLIIESQADSPVFHISSPIMEIPHDKEEMLKLFAAALSLNLFLVETRGATIALAQELHQMMLCLMEEKERCDETRFARLIEGVYETVLTIREKLRAMGAEGSKEGAVPEMKHFVRD